MLNQTLKDLLDFHRFAENPRLARLIADTERRCFRDKDENALDEDSLSQVSAAGDTDARLGEGRAHEH